MSLTGDGLEGGVHDDGSAPNVVEGEAGHCPEELTVFLYPSQVSVAFYSCPIWYASVFRCHTEETPNKSSRSSSLESSDHTWNLHTEVAF